MLEACGGLAWSAAGGWRRFGVVGFADPGGEDRKPVASARGWAGVMVPGVWKAAATTAKGCAKRTVATRLLAGLRAKPPEIAAGSGLVLHFLRGRHYACAVGRVPCHQGPRGVPGAFVDVSRARNSPRHSSSCRLTTLVVEIESMCIRGDVRGKGIGYPIGAG